MKRAQILTKIKRTILSKDPNAEVFLFGSRARKDYNSESDWDILVLINKDHVSLEDEQKFRHSLYDIELDSGEVISLIIYSKKEWNKKLKITPLFKNVNKEGIRL